MQSKSLIIATAGHVDHGKTSLVNRITGTDTDTLLEEKQRGLTINLGFAYQQFVEKSEDNTSQYTLGFVDVPGHIDFISNMLAGVGNVDLALLVIAADDGIMPQTIEHLSIINLLGIKRGAVALTKIDRVESNRLSQLKTEIGNFLSNSSMQSSPVFPLSNHSGEGIEELEGHLKKAVIGKKDNQHEIENKNFRFLIDRAFSVKGIGTVITGSVRSGAAHKNSETLYTGNGQAVRLRSIRLHETTIDSISASQRAALNVDLELDQVARGQWLIDPVIFRPVNRFDATLDLLDASFEVKASSQYHLYIGASHHIVSLRFLDKENRKFAQVKSDDSLIAHCGDRFIIRDPAGEHTIGGGVVIDIFVPRKKRSSEHRLNILNAMCGDDKTALKTLAKISPNGIDLHNFLVNRNLTVEYINNLIGSLNSDNNDYLLLQLKTDDNKVLLHRNFFDDYTRQILAQIQDFHTNNPSQQGISEPALSRAVSFAGSHYLFHALLQSLIDEKLVKRTGTLLHKPDYSMSLSKEEEEFLAKVKPILEKSGNVPPRTRELVDLTGIPLKPLERILRQTTKAGSLIQVADNRHYLPETVMALAKFTENLADSSSSEEGFSVIQFRDASGIGRNLCIEILEYFDRVGFTRRDGNARFLRTEKENIFGA